MILLIVVVVVDVAAVVRAQTLELGEWQAPDARCATLEIHSDLLETYN